MPDSCCCPNEVCDLPAKDLQRPILASNACPESGKLGKPVQGQTVKALVSVSLREVEDTKYLFCRTQSCSVVYFSAENAEALPLSTFESKSIKKSQKPTMLLCATVSVTQSAIYATRHPKNVLPL